MAKKYRPLPKSLFIVAGLILLALLLFWLFKGTNFEVLNPKGEIATKQYHLIIFATVLSLLVILPVFAITFAIVRKYRVDRYGDPVNEVTYQPEWSDNKRLELTWWGIPGVLILILSAIIIQSSYALDPFKPLASADGTKAPLNVQVIALQWKWLFLLPDQRVASINDLSVPVGTPINFHITSDAPMNSFWVPQLGGQVYAMSGMTTQLHLRADQPGDYRGVSANISGDGFAGMKFTVHAVSQAEFDRRTEDISSSAVPLSASSYASLAEPSKDEPKAFYTLPDKGLYDTVVMKYMAPAMMAHGSGQTGRTEQTELTGLPTNTTHTMGADYGASHN